MRVLFIAHYFPPIGGAGVQRIVKFVKHLQSLGIFPIVLSGDGNPGGQWSPEDQSLLAEVGSKVPIFRVIDPPKAHHQSKRQRDRLRVQSQLELGERVINEVAPDMILVTMSPFQDSLVAAELSRRHDMPWVADLRDPWALDEFQEYESALHRRLELRKMRSTLCTASLIIMNTPEAETKLRETFPELDPAKVTNITNGYDADDFKVPVERPGSDLFTIVHSGHLHTESGLRQKKYDLLYRALGRIESGVKLLPRSHFYLIEALRRWRLEDPGIERRVALVLVGALRDQDVDLVKRSPVAGMAQFTNYLSHADSLRWVRTADLLFLPMHKLPEGRRATIVPGKTYEYMASGRPILGAVPDGDAKDLILRCGTGRVCDPDDPKAMLEIIKEQFNKWQRGAAPDRQNVEFVKMFERKRLAKSLADKLRGILLSAS